MFRVIGSRILFRDQEVAKLDPWLRETVRMDISEELDGHIPVKDASRMIERIADLEAVKFETDTDSLSGAAW
jgi:hypothetical protein